MKYHDTPLPDNIKKWNVKQLEVKTILNSLIYAR